MATQIKSFLIDDASGPDTVKTEVKWSGVWHELLGLHAMLICTCADHPGQYLCSVVMNTANMTTFDPPAPPETLCAAGTKHEANLESRRAAVDV